jgi:hypothetical protein
MNEAIAPVPTVEAVFHVEPHPDPVVRALIAEIERLRQENEKLKMALYGREVKE